MVKKEAKHRQKTLLQPRWAMFICVVMVLYGLFSCSLASAWDWDNVKEFEKGELEYGKITVYNAFNFPLIGSKLAEYTLTDNTDKCLINCYAEGTAKLYDSGLLFSDLNFYNRERQLRSLKDSKILIEVTESYEVEVPVYNGICEEVTNKTNTTIVCWQEQIGSYKEIRYNTFWKDYLGEILEEGDYHWRIEAKKKMDEDIDWIGSAFGEDFTEWAWWNNNWTKKKPIDVSVSSGSTPQNYSIELNITYDSDMNASFKDLRFVNGSENAELDYWIEEKVDSSWALVWVEVDQNITTSNYTFYMYYDNQDVETTSNGTNTFDFFDDFNRTNSGTVGNNWVEDGIGTHTESIVSNQLELYASGLYTRSRVTKAVTTTSPDLVRSKMKTSYLGSDSGTYQGLGNGTHQTFYIKFGQGKMWRRNSAAQWVEIMNIAINTYYEIEIKNISWTAHTYDLWVDGIKKKTGADFASFTASVNTSFFMLEPNQYTSPITDYVDYVIYGDGYIEPNYYVGAEESPPPGPTIILHNPTINAKLNSNLVTFNGTVYDDGGVVNVSLILDGVYNETNTSGINNTNYTFVKTLADGSYNWFYEACDDEVPALCTNASSRSFSIDTVYPTINLTAPPPTIDYHITGDNLTVNWTVSDEHLDSCWFEYNNTNTTVTCGDNHTEFAGIAQTNLTFYVNDTFGNLNSEFRSWVYTIFENSKTYDSEIYETDSGTYVLNITYNSTTYFNSEADLIYEGVRYATTRTIEGDHFLFTKAWDIPLVTSGNSTNRSLYWEIIIYSGVGSEVFNTSTVNQTINRIYLEKCNGTYATETLNFTAYYETNLSQIDPYSFSGNFDFWLGNGVIKRNQSYENTSTKEFRLCLQPNKTFYVDALIEYVDVAGDCGKRTYYFEDYTISNSSQTINLLLLVKTDSTTFIQEVLEIQEGVPDAYIYTYKYYPGSDEWRLTQVSKTDSDGKTAGFYQIDVAIYKHIIIVEGITRINETEGRKIIPESSPYTITWNIGVPLEIPWGEYDDELDLTKSLTYSSTTYLVTFQYIDTDSDFAIGRLIVYQENYTGVDLLICNETSALSSAQITCNMTGYEGRFIARGYVTRTSVILVDTLRFIIDTAIATFGKLGLFLGFFIILVVGMIFLWNPIVDIIAINITIILINFIGLIKFGGIWIFGIIAVSIIAIWLLKN